MKLTKVVYTTGTVYLYAQKWRVEVAGTYLFNSSRTQPGWLESRRFDTEEEATALLEEISPMLEEQAAHRAAMSALDTKVVEAVNKAGKMMGE